MPIILIVLTDRIYYVCRYGLFSIISCIDTAYSYRPSSVVCRSVCHSSELCKNGWTNQDAVWEHEDSGGSKEPRI